MNTLQDTLNRLHFSPNMEAVPYGSYDPQSLNGHRLIAFGRKVREILVRNQVVATVEASHRFQHAPSRSDRVVEGIANIMGPVAPAIHLGIEAKQLAHGYALVASEVELGHQLVHLGHWAQHARQSEATPHVSDQNVPSELAIRLGMQYRYLIRALPDSEVDELAQALAAAAQECMQQVANALESTDSAETLIGRVMGLIAPSNPLSTADHILNQCVDAHKAAYSTTCPNQEARDKLVDFLKRLSGYCHSSYNVKYAHLLLQYAGCTHYHGVTTHIRGFESGWRTLLSGLFHYQVPPSNHLAPAPKELSGCKDFHTPAGVLGKLTRWHQGCKTPFRRTIATCCRLALRAMMESGINHPNVVGWEEPAARNELRAAVYPWAGEVERLRQRVAQLEQLAGRFATSSSHGNN